MENRQTLESIASRAHYLATQMIYQANHRTDKEKGDPKVGGHASASASSLHIMGALHLVVKSGFDLICNKPHASPTDHAYNYLLDLFLKSDKSKLSLDEANQAMLGLRKYPQDNEYVFQSYHSAYDPDFHNFLPTGTVGIPPVNIGYLALAYRYAKEHGFKVPKAHFWALCGDAEFREGSLYEAVPDFAERQLNTLTWIVDYNRQSLDGHRITNKKIMSGTDAQRIENTMAANGWKVIQVKHGQKRLALFKKKEGSIFKKFLEEDLEDYELQALLLIPNAKTLKKDIQKEHPQIKKFIDSVTDIELFEALRDFGGHDILALVEAMEEAKQSKEKPTIIIAHTLKGWGLKSAAQPGNHSQLPTEDEVKELMSKQGIKGPQLFERFSASSKEGQFLKMRGEKLYSEILEQQSLKEKNEAHFLAEIEKMGEIPDSLDINTKLASYPHTQWMLGQLTSKLTRIANTTSNNKTQDKENTQKELTDFEKRWKVPSELFVSMAPDVGTSTNLNPAMDGKIFGVAVVEDLEAEYGVKDLKTPDLVPGEDASDRFLRFDIEEGNVMSCVGSFGKIRDTLGIPLIPLMTVYDFFIKRALDQYFYNLYWKSSFICVGTPSGVTLSPEGAQHGWKSDFQIPNQITWEPFYCQEVDWILCDTIKRHILKTNEGRTGTLLRLVTRGAEQKDMMLHLGRQARFKANQVGPLCRSQFPMNNAMSEEEIPALDTKSILSVIKDEVLQGAYYLIDYRGYSGYEPGDNVVNIFTMGSLTTEALKASEELLARGIYANVIVVTSPDLLCGNLAHENDYHYLKNALGLNSNLYLRKDESVSPEEFMTVSGKRIPIVSVHDGEPGLLDNLGSIVGVKQISLAVRKHSKCGRPSDIYHFHSIDHSAVIEAVGKALSETALEKVMVSKASVEYIEKGSETASNWSEFWPTKISSSKH